jgi:hypothetical protein
MDLGLLLPGERDMTQTTAQQCPLIYPMCGKLLIHWWS